MLSILFQDARLVAIHKPHGLLTHRTGLDAGETRFALQLLRQQLGRHVYPVHRLDKGTSGVLLFALDRETAGALARQFEHDAVRKTYLAVVRGHPPESGEVDHPLSRDRDASPADTVAPARPALTRYRTLATVELPLRVDRYPTSRYALVELSPVTGRRHQLRRHMKHIAHPIIGDATHGKGVHNRAFRKHLGTDRLLLACVEVELEHPVTRRPLTLTAPLEGDFLRLVDALGWAAAVPQCWLGDPPRAGSRAPVVLV